MDNKLKTRGFHEARICGAVLLTSPQIPQKMHTSFRKDKLASFPSLMQTNMSI